MPGWELGDVKLQMRAFGSVDPWVDAPDTFTAPFGGKLDFRMAFYVVNGSGTPIPTGELQLEGNVDGGGYNDWIGGLFKFANPGYTEFPVVRAPDWFEGEIAFQGYDGSTIQFRVRADWTTSGYSPVMTCPVESAAAFAEGTPPAGGFVEQEAPSGGFAEGTAPAGGFAEQGAPAGGFVEGLAPTGGFAEGAAPAGGFVEGSTVAGGFVEGATVAGGFVEQEPPAGGFVEQDAPAGGFVEQTSPAGGFTEGA